VAAKIAPRQEKPFPKEFFGKVTKKGRLVYWQEILISEDAWISAGGCVGC
jgi:hypothetical protein